MACVARYLLVDDSPTIRLTLAAAIRNAHKGLTDIIEAGDVATAIKAFTDKKPDVVFLDLMLPGGGSGIDALRAMLEMRPDVKVILITGLPQDHPTVVEGISSGAFAYLAKPARTETVRKILNDIESESGRFSRIR